MNRFLRPCIATLLFASVSILRAEDAPRKGPPPPPPEARQFDFWIGKWEVTNPAGKVAGHSHIELILDGRALQEHWTGAGGFTGTSLNIYDADAKVWRQFWIDRTGGVLQLSGRLIDGRMVLEGTSTSDGKTAVDRITWTPNADGTVRQLWEKSTDDRQTWSVAFDGRYRREHANQPLARGVDEAIHRPRRATHRDSELRLLAAIAAVDRSSAL